ncbi:putative lipid II flippase FtsW [Thiothrix lacustris]|uniref:Probable peptidoglycan glycosyltransferase FtsW n=1 Tax=Thiothrix lacustris TaxID=525917 RepID=A0ABY9MMV1_9GAMM|nr:putative lipid II flippase FtsW [Thiothrix lacustris]WML89868.1 putative lipid II flippase FtsW [Thiothrix lacustris]WMP18526.1 putative lipid II flippase FtsW [Thiothrix lacustris]
MSLQPPMPMDALDHDNPWARYIDRDLLLALLAIIGIGVVILASASMWVAQKQYDDPYFYLQRQTFYLAMGVILAIVMYQIRVDFWQQLGVRLLPIVLALLVLVLIPGIGKEVNGSRRWLNFGFMAVQVSEMAKLIMLLYLSGYLIRHGKDLSLSKSHRPLLIPLLVLGITGGLLLLEPDFGSTIVIFVTGLSLLFLGGVPLKRLGILLGGAILVMIPVSMMGYRSARWDALINPWAHEADKGYQTVHALMAIGDGGWFGNGLGGGIQKLFYLPEAHNDFIFSILAEEFGFIGMLIVLSLYGWLVMRAFVIGFQADKVGKHFGAYVAYGIGFWIGFQVILHIGVNLAVLPPKGLTLPLMSYGGSSLMITLAAMALLMRVHRETQLSQFGVPEQRTPKPKKVRAIKRTARGE